MYPSTFLIVINYSIILLEFGGFLICLFILFIIYRKKNKVHSSKIRLLENDLNKLTYELNLKKESLDVIIDEKTKDLQEQIVNRQLLEIENKIALKKAEESNFLQNTFLSSMSREIRTPLSGIIGFSHILLHEIDQQEKPELFEIAKEIANSSDNLLKLMGHIIDLSRIETNDYELKIDNFDVNSVIETCLEKIKDSSNEKGLLVELKPSEIFLAKGDKEAFEKSLDLILDNAIKYTLTGKINIDLKANINKNQLKILISDTGIGIDKNFLSDIFKAFRPVGTGYSRIQQGAGLGLPLAHKLMLLMNCKMQIESEKNKGTIVSFILPLVYAEQDNKEQAQPIGIHIDKKDYSIENQPSIFIVEDDKMNRMIFEKMLNKNSLVKIAIDGDDGFKKLEDAFQSNHVFDIILLDINLPAPWDGMILLKEFKKKWPELNKIPFIAQTAYAMTGDKEKFLAIGFDDYISKPIDMKELYTIINNNLRKFGSLKNISHEK